jgi:hypothetical protein
LRRGGGGGDKPGLDFPDYRIPIPNQIHKIRSPHQNIPQILLQQKQIEKVGKLRENLVRFILKLKQSAEN